MVELAFFHIAVFVVAAIAGFIGPIAGGGGLLMIPSLVLLGAPSEVAIASVRLGAIGLWVSALYRYHRGGLVPWKRAFLLSFFGIAGGYIGSRLLIWLSDSSETVDTYVAIIILCMLPITYVYRRIKKFSWEPPVFVQALGYPLFLLVMSFAGFFSGGDGTLGIYVLVLCFGCSIVEANALRALPWLCMGIVASTQYIQAGLVDYTMALDLFLGMFVGGYIGASTAIKKGEDWVQRVFTVVVLLLVTKLLFF